MRFPAFVAILGSALCVPAVSGQSRFAGGLRRTPALPLCASTPACPWPAEPPTSAVNLTSIEGPGTNDFHVDLSGAFWNPYENALWVCRNGGTGGSKVW